MAVFGLSNKNNEIIQLQMGRYISINEAVWRILDLRIHKRYPAVQYLNVYLKNDKRLYFTEENVEERAAQPQNKTHTAFFQLCQADNFAKTLLHYEVPKYYTWYTISKMFYRRKRRAVVPDYVRVRAFDAMGRVCRYSILFDQNNQNNCIKKYVP